MRILLRISVSPLIRIRYAHAYPTPRILAWLSSVGVDTSNRTIDPTYGDSLTTLDQVRTEHTLCVSTPCFISHPSGTYYEVHAVHSLDPFPHNMFWKCQ